jgi:starch phosphorylase
MSLIDETGGRSVRMAHLAAVGSHAVNGVARLHSELLRTSLLSDFHELWPEKFGNKTNGVTPRRFLAVDNPRLTRLISSVIPGDWLGSLDRLRELEPFADDARFRAEWSRVKLENKKELALEIESRLGIEVDPESLFDVQVKRIHEYKRQHLNILGVIARFLDIRENGAAGRTPRTVIFAGKAAPGYFLAKLIIKLIHSVAEVLNRDPSTRSLLKVVFLPDYNVKNSRRIFPAADLSEQISTAGKEASGTGNMKLAMNGALTLGTYDGANIEIRDEVGASNFFLFGLRAEEVSQRKSAGYRPRDLYESDPRLKAALDLVADGFFSGGDRALFRPLLDSLLGRDDYMVCADFASYLERQRDVDLAYLDREGWTRGSILNVSRTGKFSSDRAIAEYSRDIWHVQPVVVKS